MDLRIDKDNSVAAAKEEFKRLCKEINLAENHILSKRRDAYLVDARQAIAKALRYDGYTYPVIGEVMDRCHTSIMHLIKVRGEHG